MKLYKGKYGHAFSLVEMLMALLVASLLLAALAPVITRKLNESLHISTAAGDNYAPANFKCWDYDSPELQLANDGTNYKVLPEPYKIDDAWVVNFIIASGGGGGAGGTISETVNDTYSGGDDGLKITYDMDEFEIDTMTGGGGGAGGGAGKYSLDVFNANENDCKNYGKGKTDTAGNTGENFATYDDTNKVCVTKFNQVTETVNSDNQCYSIELGLTCDNEQYSMAYPYSGCKRAVCNYTGAVNACKYLKEKTGDAWELLTSEQASKWEPYENWAKLALCSYQSNSYIATCGGNDKIWPSAIWSSDALNIAWIDSSGYQIINNSEWLSGNYFLSTRCVIKSARVERFYSIPGGNGGSAPKLSKTDFNSTIKETLNKRIRENIGGKIVFEAGKGGKGADNISKKDFEAEDGLDGEPSCIVVKDSGGVEKYKVCVPGGKGGKGGDGTVTDASDGSGGGEGGASVAAINACYAIDYTENPAGVTTYFNCTSKGQKGANGVSTTENRAFVDGAEGETAGQGGYGGGAIKVDDPSGGEATLNFGKGGKGGDGAVTLSYKHKYEAGGGGGGGGGYVAHIKNVNVGKSAGCNIKVGYGGSGGGSAGARGRDGGYSSVVCSNAPNLEYRVLGGSGGMLGASATVFEGNGNGGLGGKAGIYDDTKGVFTALKRQEGAFEGFAGQDGQPGGNIAASADNYKEYVRSAGGRGGAGGSGSNGKCGALYNEADLCSMVTPDENNEIPEPKQEDLNGQGFKTGSISAPLTFNKENPKYGNAGAGGGGGAWYAGKNPGSGGNGQGGYVCIYWEKLKNE